ncbi:TPA: hypothetical protein U2Q78_003710 [Klebsiella aerogenes]|uniref:hypothetical protein n=1 Tax=Klebsiella aerogenes TaxID=548 RepID=UPI0007B3BF06|nr:hypothetical protein [Klebsiella aerogenes]KZR05550.1 hypothetical protein A3N63_01050 [Klebsiella aerogenes]HCM7224877.1 hypothetical protein [Klebsiella aerogenes]HDG7789940.1 hypothetical protein [Klebsiella aerogenes]HEJ0414953.1 hypothetical protein [Klebsiella aerogenes]HEM8736300.1 hypothetical protein [Klebsiella aerogenes]
MSISSMVKFRMETDRYAAIALDRAVRGVQQNSISVLEDVRSGLERATWYSTCLLDEYKAICSELSEEDIRFIKCIYEIYKRKNIIADMMRMYIEEELKYLKVSEIKYLDISLAKGLSSYRSGLLTRGAIANALSIIIVNSFNFKNDVMMQLNRSSFVVVTAASLYGKVQTAAISARKLRDISPQLYLALYNNNMEMLYFLVSDKIDRALINAIGLRGEERILSVMKSLAY